MGLAGFNRARREAAAKAKAVEAAKATPIVKEEKVVEKSTKKSRKTLTEE